MIYALHSLSYSLACLEDNKTAGNKKKHEGIRVSLSLFICTSKNSNSISSPIYQGLLRLYLKGPTKLSSRSMENRNSCEYVVGDRNNVFYKIFRHGNNARNGKEEKEEERRGS